jgi:hypothetical protein
MFSKQKYCLIFKNHYPTMYRESVVHLVMNSAVVGLASVIKNYDKVCSYMQEMY